MDTKSIITLGIIFIIIAVAWVVPGMLESSITSSVDNRSYTVPFINEDLTVLSDGTLHVKETIGYSFKGTYNGVYRDIPVKDYQNITDMNVSSQGAYSNFTTFKNQGGTNRRVQVFLYTDPSKTTPITNRDVNVTLEYNFLHVVKFYNDVAELQYQLVGTQWTQDIGKVNANIHVNSSQGIQYWINPPYYASNSGWQNNTLAITGKTIPAGQFFEVRMVMPKDQFQTNATNGVRINQDALSQIQSIQNDYQNSINFWTYLYYTLAILFFLALFIPLIIYMRFGREPKIDYSAEYERDIPTNDPPAYVNAICGPGFSKKVGEPDMDGFKATIMDLIDRKYFIMENQPSEKEGYGISGSMNLRYNPDMNTSNLKRFEKEVINFLYEFEEDGIISLDRISADLSNRSTALSFRSTYNSWKEEIKSKFSSKGELNKYFSHKGDDYIKIFGLIGIVAAAVGLMISYGSQIPSSIFTFVMSIVLGIVSIISLILPQKIGGQWTTYGEEYDAKWQNFKKYIKDFSLIKEYPPESIVIWNKYLVYATALGAAEAVKKAMELYVPKEQLENSDIYMFHYYGGYMLLSSAFDTGMSTASSSSSSGGGDFGGVGDIGGGDGGGGGGAF